MINYIREIVGVCKLPFDEIIKEYKIIQLGNRIIYISNFIKIIDYSDERLVLKVKNGLLEIKANNLKIQHLNKGEIVLKGKIYSYSLEMVNEE